MAGVTFIAKPLIQLIEGATKMGIVLKKKTLVYTDKPVRKAIQKYHCLG